MEILKEKTMITRPIMKNSIKYYKLPVAFTGKQVLWFGINILSDIEHDWYGNIRFQIDSGSFFQKFNHIYELEMKKYRTKSCLRFVLTNIRIDEEEIKKLKVQPKEICGGNFFQSEEWAEHSYDVEIIVLEPSQEEKKWLFDNAHMQIVNHKMANTPKKYATKKKRFIPHKCHKFNSKTKICPSPFSIKRCIFEILKIPNCSIVINETIGSYENSTHLRMVTSNDGCLQENLIEKIHIEKPFHVSIITELCSPARSQRSQTIERDNIWNAGSSNKNCVRSLTF